MNIVYVSREYGPITGGGIGTYIANVCKAMLDRGHTVYLLTDCVNSSNSSVLPHGLKVVTTQPMPDEEQGGCFSYNHEYSHRVYNTLRALCDSVSVDVVEFAEYCGEGFISIRAKRLMGAFSAQTLIVKCHTPLSLLEKINEDREFHAWVVCDIEMEDYCIRYADKVTSPSQSLADYFKKRVGRDNITICPYPLYLEFAQQPLPVFERDLNVIRFFGSIQVRKGVDTFIEAAKKVLKLRPELRFELVGKERNAHFFNRTYIDVLQDMIPQELKEKIVFSGGIPYEQVARLLDQSGLIVLPSRWENWANACLESMAKGCVVMASSSGGMAEMIQHEINGFIIDPLDSDALANQILFALSDEDKLQQISDAAIVRAHILTEPDQTAQRIEHNYLTAKRIRNFKSECTPLVSVIIPFYNQSTTIQETINSVRCSHYPNVEIVVVDDGSTSPSAIRCFEALDGVVKVNKPNGGLSSARNAGINASVGRYFLPLDSDDLLHPDYIRHAVDALENNPDLGYVSCYTRNFEAIKTPYYPVGYVAKLMPFLNTSGKCTNLYRKNLFDRVGGYDECMNSYEDWDYLLSLQDAGIEGDVLPQELFYYRRNYASMVFSTANPIRANLIQYMMLKHRESWKQDSEMIAMILLRLWKDAEIREESHVHEEFRIYWGIDGALSEKQTKATSFLKSGFTKIECVIPYNPAIDTLRLDFAVSEMEIRLHRLLVNNLLDGKSLICCDPIHGWDSFSIAGTAVGIASNIGAECRIRSTGNDPQLLLRTDAFKGAELQVIMEFEVI